MDASSHIGAPPTHHDLLHVQYICYSDATEMECGPLQVWRSAGLPTIPWNDVRALEVAYQLSVNAWVRDVFALQTGVGVVSR